jgi:hypothetical protein
MSSLLMPTFAIVLPLFPRQTVFKGKSPGPWVIFLTKMLIWNLALFSFLLFFVFLLRARKRSLGRRPPGPKGWPILGNISDIPKKNPWLTYMEWQKIYGDIVYIEPFGTPTVILNNLEDIHELLDKRSAITSSRPRMVGLIHVLIINCRSKLPPRLWPMN